MHRACRARCVFAEIGQKWSYIPRKNVAKPEDLILNPRNPPQIQKCRSYSQIPASSVQSNVTELFESVQHPKEVLKILDRYLPGFHSNHVVMSTMVLERLMFEMIAKKKSWAYSDNRSLLCVQTFISNECHDLFLNVIETETMRKLLENVESSCHGYSDEELVTVTCNLVRLHVTPSSQVMVSLLSNCISRCPEMDLKCLATLAHAANHLGRSGFYLAGLIVQNMSQSLDALRPIGSDYRHVAELAGTVGYFCSSELVQKVIGKFVVNGRLVFGGEELGCIHPNSSLNLLEALARFGGDDVALKHKLVVPLTAHFVDCMDQLSAYQLSRLLIYLRLLKFKSPALTSLIQNRALVLLDFKDLTAHDVSCLMSVFDICGYTREVFLKLEKLFIRNVSNFDTILLKNTAQQRFLTMTMNNEVLKRFSNQVINLMPDLCNSVGCLICIVHLLPKLKSYPEELDQKLSAYITDKLRSGQLGLQSSHLEAIAQYLLHCTSKSGRISPILSESLLAMMPQFSVRSLFKLNEGVLKLKTKLNNPNRVEYMNKHIMRTLLQKIPEVSSLNELNMIIKGCPLYSIQRYSPDIIFQIEELYSKLISEAEVSNIRNTSACLADMKLYVPKVMDSLVDCAVEISEKVTIGTLSEVLMLLSIVNYVPRQIIQLRDLFVALCNQHDYEREFFSEIILSANSLAVLGIFPEEVLLKIFSADFLKSFDEYCSGLGESKQYRLKHTLCNLNRSVVLHQPHLNVPWFHEVFCKLKNQPHKPKFYTRIREDVKQCLEEILGPDNFRDKDVLSDYYHGFDFEVLLDRNRQPMNAESDLATASSKIAIYLLGPKSYCSNKRHLNGHIAAKLSELEILEYKVVTVPYYELDSMEMSDSPNLQNYFREKIFGSDTDST